jgi:signal transduction histidine kinase
MKPGEPLDQSALELQALQRVIASGARALELEVVLERCLEQEVQLARADTGVIYLRDEPSGVYRMALPLHIDAKLAPPTLAIDETVPGAHAWFDLAEIARVRPVAQEAVDLGFTHALVLVLRVEARRVGFVSLMYRVRPALAESTLRTLEALSDFEAVAIESARVHRQVELRARLAQMLSDCGERLLDPDADVPALILETAVKIARGDRAFLSRVDEHADGQRWARIMHGIGKDAPLVGMAIPVTAPYVRESMAQPAPLVVEDVSALDPNSVVGKVARKNQTQAFILITMRKGGRAVGHLFAGSGEPRHFEEAEVEAMRLLSNLAVQALARAAREAEERAEHARIAAILEHLPIVVAVVDRRGTIVHINAAGREFARKLGNSDDADWRSALAAIQILDRDGRPVPLEETGTMRAFAGHTTAREETLVTPAGQRLHVMTVAVPLHVSGGDVEMVLSSFSDVTDLRELADAKDRFLSIASHELRSPITSLRATASLLQLDPAALTDASRRQVLLSRIQRQIDRLSTLIERLLDTTRLNAGELPLDYADGDLAALCRDAVEHARLTDREHCFRVDALAGIPGRWDLARLEQVLTNLLSNACRYSPPRSEIVVRAIGDGERAVVDVTDRGVGIPPDQLEKLFTPFFRGNAAAHHKGGLGLGLYISREIVRRHGGTMRVASAIGQGSTFTVELPRRPK